MQKFAYPTPKQRTFSVQRHNHDVMDTKTRVFPFRSICQALSDDKLTCIFYDIGVRKIEKYKKTEY